MEYLQILEILIPIGLAVGIGIALASPVDRSRRLRISGLTLAALLFLGLYLVWELFFYAGELPSGIRYDFPSALLPLAMGASLLAGVKAGLSGGVATWSRFLARRAAEVAFLMFAYALVGDVTMPPVLWAATADAVNRTNAFQRDLEHIDSIARTHPDWPVIVEARHPLEDYEPVDSLPTFLQKMGITNPLFLVVVPSPGTHWNPFEQGLLTTLQQWSGDGTPLGYRPLAQATPVALLGAHCWVVPLWRPAVTPCQPIPLTVDHYLH